MVAAGFLPGCQGTFRELCFGSGAVETQGVTGAPSLDNLGLV